MTNFQCSYAGVTLLTPTEEVDERLRVALAWADLRDVQPPPRWPGPRLEGVAWVDPPDWPTPKLGRLFWPSGAARFAHGLFLATGDQLREIRQAVSPETPRSYTWADLVLRCEDTDTKASGAVTAKMFLLPPRPLTGKLVPLGQTGQEGDLYLLPLVDARYYWQWKGVTITATTTSPLTWGGAITTCGTALGVELISAIVGAAYGFVDSDSGLFGHEENAAVVLDAVLANAGQVLAANYDGTYTLRTYEQARDAAKAEWAKWAAVRFAGGPVLNLNPDANDPFRRAVLPKTVKVVFRAWLNGQGPFPAAFSVRGCQSCDRPEQVYTSNVDVSVIPTLAPLVAASGSGPTRVFHDTYKARWDDPDSLDPPDNVETLDALAARIAEDYCFAFMGSLDECYPGVIPWTPDGLNDVVIDYRLEHAQTRVKGRPFAAFSTEFQHGDGVQNEVIGDVKLIRVLGVPPAWRCDSDRELYYGRVTGYDLTTCAHPDGQLVWLIQSVDAPLGNDGTSVYMALRRANVQINTCGGGLPVYETDRRIEVVDVTCNATGGLMVTYNGRYTPFTHSQDESDCRNSQLVIVNAVDQI